MLLCQLDARFTIFISSPIIFKAEFLRLVPKVAVYDMLDEQFHGLFEQGVVHVLYVP